MSEWDELDAVRKAWSGVEREHLTHMTDGTTTLKDHVFHVGRVSAELLHEELSATVPGWGDDAGGTRAIPGDPGHGVTVHGGPRVTIHCPHGVDEAIVRDVIAKHNPDGISKAQQKRAAQDAAVQTFLAAETTDLTALMVKELVKARLRPPKVGA